MELVMIPENLSSQPWPESPASPCTNMTPQKSVREGKESLPSFLSISNAAHCPRKVH